MRLNLLGEKLMRLDVTESAPGRIQPIHQFVRLSVYQTSETMLPDELETYGQRAYC